MGFGTAVTKRLKTLRVEMTRRQLAGDQWANHSGWLRSCHCEGAASAHAVLPDSYWLPQAGAGKGGKVQKRYSLPSPEAAAVAGRGGAGQ